MARRPHHLPTSPAPVQEEAVRVARSVESNEGSGSASGQSSGSDSDEDSSEEANEEDIRAYSALPPNP